MKKYLLAGAAALAFVGLALAQVTNLVPTSFIGSETIVVQQGGPQGPSMFATTGMLRNSTGGIVQTATTGTNTWPTTSVGGVLVAGPTTANYSRLCYTGAVGTMTQNLPANPFDGQTVELINCQGSTWTALTVTQTDGSTLVNFGSALALAAGVSAEFYYLKSTNSWYRIR